MIEGSTLLQQKLYLAPLEKLEKDTKKQGQPEPHPLEHVVLQGDHNDERYLLQLEITVTQRLGSPMDDKLILHDLFLPKAMVWNFEASWSPMYTTQPPLEEAIMITLGSMRTEGNAVKARKVTKRGAGGYHVRRADTHCAGCRPSKWA